MSRREAARQVFIESQGSPIICDVKKKIGAVAVPKTFVDGEAVNVGYEESHKMLHLVCERHVHDAEILSCWYGWGILSIMS